MPRRTKACAFGDGFNAQVRLGQQFAGYGHAQAMQVIQGADLYVLLEQARQVPATGSGQACHAGECPGFAGGGGYGVLHAMDRRVQVIAPAHPRR